MKLYVARHGQSLYNALGICNSDPSVKVPLTDTGIRQAEELGDQLANTPIEAVYVSQLERTHQTADIVLRHHPDTKVIEDARLNDINTGFEGQPVIEYQEYRDQITDPWNDHFDGGESLHEVRLRIEAFIEDLKKQPYSSVLVVTSQDPGRAFRGVIEQLSDENTWLHPMDNGSYFLFDL